MSSTIAPISYFDGGAIMTFYFSSSINHKAEMIKVSNSTAKLLVDAAGYTAIVYAKK